MFADGEKVYAASALYPIPFVLSSVQFEKLYPVFEYPEVANVNDVLVELAPLFIESFPYPVL